MRGGTWERERVSGWLSRSSSCKRSSRAVKQACCGPGVKQGWHGTQWLLDMTKENSVEAKSKYVGRTQLHGGE